MPRLALASCSSLPEWELDDGAFHRALERRGVDFTVLPWDAAVDWSAFDACLIRTTWDYHLRLAEFLDWCGRVSQVTTLLNPLEVIRWNADKRYLRDLAELGVPILPTTFVEASTERATGAWRGVLEGCDRGFIKPSVGATASDTLRFACTASGFHEAEELLSSILERGLAALVQPYAATVESDGERSAIVIAGGITHAVRKTPVPGDYRVQNDWGGADEPTTLSDAEQTFVASTLAALDTIRGRWPDHDATAPLLVARVDWLTVEGHPVLNELELIEPSLFFRHSAECAEVLAERCASRRELGAARSAP